MDSSWLGAAASAVGDVLLRHLAGFNRIAGVLIIVMGLIYLVPSLLPILERERRPFMASVKPGIAGAFPLGLAFAVGWSPCVGPGLGVMLNLGAQSGSVLRGAFLLFFFSLGFGVWFLLGALGMRRAFSASGWLRRHAMVLQVIGGGVMIGIGLLLVTNRWDNVLAPLRRLINRWSPPV
ncbi:MAG: cytochrome c biogenesis protein CcdA [Actinobacteria bacterium]|nr:cytochrome c biogenesis protein CcdA [Actinomycetota bacterium]